MDVRQSTATALLIKIGETNWRNLWCYGIAYMSTCRMNIPPHRSNCVHLRWQSCIKAWSRGQRTILSIWGGYKKGGLSWHWTVPSCGLGTENQPLCWTREVTQRESCFEAVSVLNFLSLRQVNYCCVVGYRRIHVPLGSLDLFSAVHKAKNSSMFLCLPCKNGLDLCGSKKSHTGLPMARWTLAVTIIELRFKPVTYLLR